MKAIKLHLALLTSSSQKLFIIRFPQVFGPVARQNIIAESECWSKAAYLGKVGEESRVPVFL
jgi:hypothetical protein